MGLKEAARRRHRTRERTRDEHQQDKRDALHDREDTGRHISSTERNSRTTDSTKSGRKRGRKSHGKAVPLRSKQTCAQQTQAGTMPHGQAPVV